MCIRSCGGGSGVPEFHWGPCAQFCGPDWILGAGLATSVPRGTGSAGHRAVGPASASSSCPCARPPHPGGQASVRTQCPLSRSDGGLDAHAPFCAGGSGVGEWPQRVGLGPQQEEISPREEWGGGGRKDTSLKGGGQWPARPAKPVLIVMTGQLRTEMPVKPKPADAHTGLCPELLS